MTKDGQSLIPNEYLGRDVGQLSEDLLRTWVSGETALTLNSVQKDKEGWDVILEFPFITPEEGKPWDTVPPRIQCWVQVKGTDTGAKERNVKLDNWQKLISTPLPAFFLIFDFDAEELQAAYVVHIYGSWMERVLRRLRETRHGESPPLHKQSVTLTWSNEDEIEPINGVGLVKAILKHIGDDFDAYVQKKQKTRRELGLEAPFLIQITGRPYSSSDEMYSELVDFAIGKREIQLSNLVVKKEVRFGIPAEIEDHGEATARIFPEGKEVSIIYRNEAGSKRVEFAGTIIGPDYFFSGHDVPPEHKKYRLQYQLGEIIFWPRTDSGAGITEVETTFDIKPLEGQAEISELVKNWRVVSLLQNASREGLQLEIGAPGIPPTKIGFAERASVPDSYRVVAEAVENAWFLVRHLDLPTDTRVTLEEIIDHAEYLQVSRTLLDVNQPPIRAIRIERKESDDLSVNDDIEHALVIGRLVKLGEFRIFVAVGMAGPLQVVEDGTAFEISRPARAHVECFVLQEAQTVKSAFLGMYNALEKKGYEVIKYREYLAEEEE